MRNNTNTVLLVGAAAVAVYFLTRPRTSALPVNYNPYNTPAYNPYGTAAYNNPYVNSNPVAQDLTASKSALDGLANLIGTFF